MFRSAFVGWRTLRVLSLSDGIVAFGIAFCAPREGIFRIIQAIPSPKAEPFKRWMAQVASQRIDQMRLHLSCQHSSVCCSLLWWTIGFPRVRRMSVPLWRWWTAKHSKRAICSVVSLVAYPCFFVLLRKGTTFSATLCVKCNFFASACRLSGIICNFATETLEKLTDEG